MTKHEISCISEDQKSLKSPSTFCNLFLKSRYKQQTELLRKFGKDPQTVGHFGRSIKRLLSKDAFKCEYKQSRLKPPCPSRHFYYVPEFEKDNVQKQLDLLEESDWLEEDQNLNFRRFQENFKKNGLVHYIRDGNVKPVKPAKLLQEGPLNVLSLGFSLPTDVTG